MGNDYEGFISNFNDCLWNSEQQAYPVRTAAERRECSNTACRCVKRRRGLCCSKVSLGFGSGCECKIVAELTTAPPTNSSSFPSTTTPSSVGSIISSASPAIISLASPAFNISNPHFSTHLRQVYLPQILLQLRIH